MVQKSGNGQPMADLDRLRRQVMSVEEGTAVADEIVAVRAVVETAKPPAAVRTGLKGNSRPRHTTRTRRRLGRDTAGAAASRYLPSAASRSPVRPPPGSTTRPAPCAPAPDTCPRQCSLWQTATREPTLLSCRYGTFRRDPAQTPGSPVGSKHVQASRPRISMRLCEKNRTRVSSSKSG